MKKLAKNSKIKAKIKFDPEIKQERYFIPVETLPEDLQAKYYNKLKADAVFVPELKDDKKALKQRSKGILKPLEQYSEAEHEEIAFWSRLIRKWHENRDSYKNKTQYDADFCSNCCLQYDEDFSISPDISA